MFKTFQCGVYRWGQHQTYLQVAEPLVQVRPGGLAEHAGIVHIVRLGSLLTQDVKLGGNGGHRKRAQRQGEGCSTSSCALRQLSCCRLQRQGPDRQAAVTCVCLLRSGCWWLLGWLCKQTVHLYIVGTVWRACCSGAFLLPAPPPPQHSEITCCRARTTTERRGRAGAHFGAAEGRDATLLLVNARAVAMFGTMLLRRDGDCGEMPASCSEVDWQQTQGRWQAEEIWGMTNFDR